MPFTQAQLEQIRSLIQEELSKLFKLKVSAPNCVYCQSDRTVFIGTRNDGSGRRRVLCRECRKSFTVTNNKK